MPDSTTTVAADFIKTVKEGDCVDVIGGSYKGDMGKAVKLTAEMVYVDLQKQGRKLRILKSSVRARHSTPALAAPVGVGQAPRTTVAALAAPPQGLSSTELDVSTDTVKSEAHTIGPSELSDVEDLTRLLQRAGLVKELPEWVLEELHAKVASLDNKLQHAQSRVEELEAEVRCLKSAGGASTRPIMYPLARTFDTVPAKAFDTSAQRKWCRKKHGSKWHETDKEQRKRMMEEAHHALIDSELSLC